MTTPPNRGHCESGASKNHPLHGSSRSSRPTSKISRLTTFKTTTSHGLLQGASTNKILIPKIIRQRYPDLTESEVEEVRQHVVIDSVIKTGEVKEVGDKRFVKLANRFVNLDELNINLIDTINPFQRAFEVISKTVTPNVLQLISDTIAATRLDIAVEEALEAFPQIQHWAKVNGKRPDRRSEDATERYYAECLLVLRRFKQESDRRRTQESAGQED